MGIISGEQYPLLLSENSKQFTTCSEYIYIDIQDMIFKAQTLFLLEIIVCVKKKKLHYNGVCVCVFSDLPGPVAQYFMSFSLN